MFFNRRYCSAMLFLRRRSDSFCLFNFSRPLTSDEVLEFVLVVVSIAMCVFMLVVVGGAMLAFVVVVVVVVVFMVVVYVCGRGNGCFKKLGVCMWVAN